MYGGSWATRKMIVGEYARFLGGMATVYTLADIAGVDIEYDPRSSDFGKFRFGNTRIDPLSGLSQTVVFTSRVLSGKTKTGKGKIRAIRGKKVPFGGSTTPDVMTRFLRSKLAPAPAMFVDIMAGKNTVGEPTTLASVALNSLTPMAMSDIYEAMKEQGIPEGMALGMLAIFGEGIQTYNAKKKGK
jgi:hypothetical protein